MSFSHKHAFLTLFSNLFYFIYWLRYNGSHWGGWHKSPMRWYYSPLRSDEARWGPLGPDEVNSTTLLLVSQSASHTKPNACSEQSSKYWFHWISGKIVTKKTNYYANHSTDSLRCWTQKNWKNVGHSINRPCDISLCSSVILVMKIYLVLLLV